MNQLNLLLKILLVLKSRKSVSKQELMNRFECSAKQIQRYRQQLELAGYEIKVTPGKYGSYELINSSFFPFPELTKKERTLLKKAYPLIQQTSSALFSEQFHQAYQKIIGNLEANDSISIYQSRKLTINEQLLEQRIGLLQESINTQQRIELEYSNQKQYIFEPYHLFQLDIAWYVIGYIKFGDVRVFRLDRIDVLHPLDEPFLKDESFNLKHYISDSQFKIDNPILLKGIIVNNPFVKEMIISDVQKITPIDNNREYLEIQFYSLKKAKSFISSLGASLIIESPQELKQFHIQQSKQILNQYQEK